MSFYHNQNRASDVECLLKVGNIALCLWIGGRVRYLWIGFGWLCVGAGLLGAFLPLLPTTPFLLLAAYCFSRGSSRLHSWLLEHPRFGPPIIDWQTQGAINRQVKVIASLSIAAVFVLSLILGVPQWALITQGVILCFVMIFLWTRPEPQKED